MKEGSGRCNNCCARFYLKGSTVELFDRIGIGGMLVQVLCVDVRSDIDLRVIVEAHHCIIMNDVADMFLGLRESIDSDDGLLKKLSTS